MATRFLPHGYCYQWSTSLLFWQVVGDLLIALSYFAISIVLFRIVRSRRDIPFNAVVLCFAGFILACGATHLIEIWNIWQADYWLGAAVKAFTAAASAATAYYLYRLRPTLLEVPNPDQLKRLNQELEQKVGELRRTETALRASEEQFRTAFESAGIGMALVGLKGEWLQVNRRLCQFLGYSEEELRKRTFQSITHPGDLAEDLRQVERLLDGSATVYEMEKRYVHRSGHIVTARLTGALVRGPDRQPMHFIAQIEDTSDRKALEQKLLHAQRIEAVGRLAGGVAHDFNNILTSTLLQLELLDQTPDLSPAVKASVGSLRDDANRAADLTRQLLTFSHRQLMQLRAFELGESVERLARMLERLIGENILLRVRRVAPAWVHADPTMIDQVVTNMVINARDAIGDHSGTIQIDIGIREVNGGDSRARARSGAFATIVVTDTGSGLSEDAREHLFEPFFTTKGVGKGTGLGLATAYAIAEQHNGWIDVESRQNVGTVFTVFLPLSKAAGDMTRAEPESDHSVGSATVLLVEDERSVRNVARVALARHGYTVIEASDGPEALQVWQRRQSDIDVLITDMVMPNGLNGAQLAGRLLHDRPGIGVILCSGYSFDLKQAGVPAGVEFIQKPYHLSALLQLVRRVSEQRRSPGSGKPGET